MMKSMATFDTYNEELVTTVTFATNNEEFDMAVERERKYKDVEEFESIFRANNCQLTDNPMAPPPSWARSRTQPTNLAS
jgi:hypothetical protein